jgi:hypothetical protein
MFPLTTTLTPHGKRTLLMTSAPSEHAAAAAPDSGPALQFRRTVDRVTAHRAAVSEVFVTDVRPINNRRSLTGVQLPQSHAYYNDHTQEPPLTDVLLVLECCRQAAICGTHLAAGIPTGTSMLVDTFTIRLAGLADLVHGPEPIELAIDSTFHGEESRSGRVRQGRVEQVLLAGGTPIGTHEMNVMFLRGNQHAALRRAQRGSLPPSTVDLAMPDPERVVRPAAVGRVHPRNVVLSAPAVADGTVTAVVTPRPDNRALFDHAYDHLPAMTLTEAARQIALLSLDGGTGAAAARTHATAVRSRFGRFAELDAPLTVTAPVREPGGLTAPADVPAVFMQNGDTVAETTVTLAPTDRLEQR